MKRIKLLSIGIIFVVICIYCIVYFASTNKISESASLYQRGNLVSTLSLQYGTAPIDIRNIVITGDLFTEGYLLCNKVDALSVVKKMV